MKWLLIKKGSVIISPEFMRVEKATKKAIPVLKPADEKKSFITMEDPASSNVQKSSNLQSMMWNKWASYKLNTSLNQKGRSRYEIFCGGWLAYHDNIVEGGKREHFIYFKWEASRVSIYISPPNKNPKTKKVITPVWNTQKLISSQISPAIDPPKPPAPPPPPMR